MDGNNGISNVTMETKQDEAPTAAEDTTTQLVSNEATMNGDCGGGKGKDTEAADKHIVNHEDKQEKKSSTANSKPDSNNDGQPVAPVPVPPCKRRVRFSVCEYITETLVQDNGSHTNPAFQNEGSETDKNKENSSEMDSNGVGGGGSKVRYIGGKLRRDSVHPLVPFHPAQMKKDHWDVVSQSEEEDEKAAGVPWSDLSTKGKVLRVSIGIGKGIALLGLLYFFVCSLDLLSLGFRLVGGSTAGEIFQNSDILGNPVVGLMLGILTTVLVQSSSTSSSILVGMVAAGFMDVKLAIPPIMGANIGTSITNTIVSFTQAADRDQFRRAFAGATVLDMFNWITVLVLLPIEVIFGYLYHVSKATTDLLIPEGEAGGEVQVLSVITRPFVDLIVQLNNTVMDCWADPDCHEADGKSLILEFCSTSTTEIQVQERVVDLNGKEVLNIRDVSTQEDLQKCDFLFAGTSMSDAAVGAILLVSSLIVLCTCLVLIVKILNTVMKGHVSTIIKHTLNANIPYVPWLTGYIAILIGAVMTFLVQSSSVFTSTLTPLVGLGVISLDRVYPLTLGANIGTTTTALLASLAAEGKNLHPSLQIALCHFFFNVTGVILFYPVPFLRFPIPMAKALGSITAKYRWFAIFYLVAMFAVLPAVFIGLSLLGSIYVIILISLIGAVVVLVVLLTILQRKVPQILPEWLQNWKWLPRPMRSLKPYDNLVSKMPCCRGKGGNNSEDDSDQDSDDDEEYGYSGGRSKLDGDFVFLTGNKIPPPHLSNGVDNHSSQDVRPRRCITRIVPTRVIRNISNGDYPNSNGYTPQQNEVVNTSPNGGIQNGGIQNGGIQNGGIQNGGIQNGGIQNGGIQNGGIQNGGIQNGGIQNGGIQNGGIQNGAIPPPTMIDDNNSSSGNTLPLPAVFQAENESLSQQPTTPSADDKQKDLNSHNDQSNNSVSSTGNHNSNDSSHSNNFNSTEKNNANDPLESFHV